MHIKIPVIKFGSSEKKERELTFPISALTIEDWFEADRTTIVPNRCKIHANGQTYQANISKNDLEAMMEQNGHKIIKQNR